MFRILIAMLALCGSLGLAACNNAGVSKADVERLGASQNAPDLTGISQGDMGWTDQSQSGYGMAITKP